MDEKRLKYNLLMVSEFSSIKSTIINEIEFIFQTNEQYRNDLFLQRLSKNVKYRNLESNEFFHKFIISVFLNNPRTYTDIMIPSFYLSNIEGIIDMIKNSHENIIELLNQLAIEFKYEFHKTNKLLIRKGI